MILDAGKPTDLSRNALVYLDGVRQELCTYVDDVRGVLCRYRMPFPSWDDAREVLEQEWKTGQIRIVDKRELSLHDVYTRCDRD